VKAWKLMLPVVLVLAAVAMVPQDPQTPTPQHADAALADQVAVITMSELKYMDLQGVAVCVPARSVIEIRLVEDRPEHIRLELIYENGDYSLINAQSFHLLRNGQTPREVRLVRSQQSRMRFPRMP
jgi:hypothetical protein